ncbi:hypothetical protein [Amaricoccus macauensis]|uniref:hypothetical protein n=1 Tax=Amaricoccus macauensis TaxID=57001 RepID=UPI003C7D1191
MLVDGRSYRSLWLDRDGRTVRIIDQRWLPHELWVVGLNTLDEAIDAIAEGRVRGGPLTAAVAAYGIAFAMFENPSNLSLMRACGRLAHVTAASAEAGWVLREMNRDLLFRQPWQRREAAYVRALDLCETDVANRRRIGEHGVTILKQMSIQRQGRPLKVLALSSAGWLSAVDWGSAFAPIYSGREAGIPMHVLLDSGLDQRSSAALIRWELAGQGLSHSTISTETGPDLMREGLVDLVFLDAQSVSLQGDVRNLEPASQWVEHASAHGIPCYAAATFAAIGWGDLAEHDDAVPLLNQIGSDVTMSQHLTGLITERGICRPARDALGLLFPDRIEAA